MSLRDVEEAISTTFTPRKWKWGNGVSKCIKTEKSHDIIVEAVYSVKAQQIQEVPGLNWYDFYCFIVRGNLGLSLIYELMTCG